MHATTATFLPGGIGNSPLSNDAAYASLLAIRSSVTLISSPLLVQSNLAESGSSLWSFVADGQLLDALGSLCAPRRTRMRDRRWNLELCAQRVCVDELAVIVRPSSHDHNRPTVSLHAPARLRSAEAPLRLREHRRPNAHR